MFFARNICPACKAKLPFIPFRGERRISREHGKITFSCPACSARLDAETNPRVKRNRWLYVLSPLIVAIGGMDLLAPYIPQKLWALPFLVLLAISLAIPYIRGAHLRTLSQKDS